MAKKTFESKFNDIMEYHATIARHWADNEGIFHGKSKVWTDIYHSRTPEFWREFVEIGHKIIDQFEAAATKYPGFYNGLDTIEARLDADKKVIIKYATDGSNTPVFKCVMEFHDLVNEINGTPTKQYKKPNPNVIAKPQVFKAIPKRKPTNKFNDLFDLKA